MTVKKCDRCKKIINNDLLQQAVFPDYAIAVFNGVMDMRNIDLCPLCRDELTEWLKGEEDDGK